MGRPLYFTAHLDHPAFVIERIVAPAAVEVSFRGGVMDEYFKDAAIVLWTSDDRALKARLTEAQPASGPFKHYLAELPRGDTGLNVGDVGVWDVGPAEIIDGNMHTLACDDLAAAAAALAAMDVLVSDGSGPNVSLLFTRAEEVGFIGAIAAVRETTMPKNARVIALENSRSFPESPIGGGPIVRVGDRISVFSPTLTDAIAKRAEEIAGGPASVTAAQKHSDLPAWKWQRKLMAGGACEASVYFNAGYEATCVCLPLGNYHNMADLTAVQERTNTTPPKVGREFISVADYQGLVDLLVGCGRKLPAQGGMSDRFDKLWEERKYVLG
jgi:endoglucanase